MRAGIARVALAAGVGVALLAGCGQSDRVELRAVAPSTTAAPSPVAPGERDPLPVRPVPTTRASRSSGAGGRATAPGRAAVRQPTIGPAEVVAVIHAVFGPAGDSAARVAKCESGFNPRAVSPGGSNLGLMQINTVHRKRWERMGYSREQMLEAEPNTRVAYAIFREQGWRPWACRWAA